MFVLTSILLGLLLVYVIFTKRKPKGTYLDTLPEPPGNPVFGHALDVTSSTGVIGTFTKYLRKYGKSIRMHVGPSIAPLRAGIISVDYKFVEFILSSNKMLTKGETYMFVKPWLANGLIVSDGLYWKRHRKILTPAFHFEILKQFVETFESVGNVLIQKLEQFDGSPSVDLQPLVTLCALDVICETAMGTKMDAQSGKSTDYVKSVEKMCQIVVNRCMMPTKFYDATFVFTKDYYIQRKALGILHSFTKRVINSKKGNQSNLTNGKKMAFLDKLLKLSEDGKVLSKDEIQEEVDTFMFAGHDTTSTTICFTLYCIANHPEVQNKILQEQKDLFGDDKSPTVTYTELQNMKYLEMVIKEALRLYPPVAFLFRLMNEDVEYEGSVIPKGTNIGLLLYELHRNPEYFPEPEKFNPDRFENFDNSLPYSYVPFSAGPRNCIGQKFALLEMKSLISKIIRHFELRPAVPKHELVVSFEIVLKSANGVKVGFVKRK